MSAVSELTERLIDCGMSPSDAMALVARAGAEMMVPTRSKGADRTARWRAKKASQTVTERHAVTPETQITEASPSVTDRHKPSQCDAASLSKRDKKEEIEGKRERRATQLGDGWRPQPTDRQTAVELLGEETAEIELQKFADHARTKGRVAKDWNAAWRNWVRRAVEYRGGRNATPQARPAQAGWQQRRDKWFDALAELKETVAAADASDEGGPEALRLVVPSGRG